MERVLNSAHKACPFLHNASAATLRHLSVKAPSGAASSKLMTKAQQCPVMGKAIAVQTSRFHTSAKVATPTASAPRAMAAHEPKKAGKNDPLQEKLNASNIFYSQATLFSL